ncbi:SDR family oxidoreductase [Microscilla marina]|uniref:Short chain dehydrogenase n=1 Tax=Microscilla marina ATCC 23134 TaxID=313606 RepID=A1ZM53_MICM2|nr:SDR family oxidoreductase [Microscilla marina]EAY28584.1 short chain dehydrogenase [Microscilla marina ATCC 23134]
MKKVAFITGANKGIGFEASRQLAKKGITVIMGSRSDQRGKQASEQLKSEGLDVEFLKLDITQPESFDEAKKYIDEKYGQLDILVNNAGIIHSEESWGENTTETVSLEALRQTFEVNFFGLVALTQKLLPLIRKSKQGYITNVSSILGSVNVQNDAESGWYGVKPFAYNASKTALNSFTVHLVALLKDTNIKVNSAHPGWVKTDLGTDAAPMDVVSGAKTLVNLSLEEKTSFTGKFIHLDEEVPW